MKPFKRILIKVLELITCVACVTTKALTDQESKRVFLLNQKLSREWSLLHNITWSTAGSAYANVTYGGFTLVTGLMVISRIIDSRSRPSIIEKIFLTMGMFMFFIMGGLVFAAIDQVPSDLHDNAIILGCLSFLVAFLFIVDLSDPLARHTTDATQTDSALFTTVESGRLNARPIKNNNKTSEAPEPLSNGIHHVDQIDLVETSTLPSVQQPVFARLLTPEKIRVTKSNITGKPSASLISRDYSNGHQGNSDFTDDILSSRTNSYVRGAVIDKGNFILRKPPTLPVHSDSNSNECPKQCQEQQERTVDEIKTPITPGYVVHSARMWDKRAKCTRRPPIGQNTNV